MQNYDAIKQIRQLKKQRALRKAFRVLCDTGDPTPFAEAFKAIYGKYPVYLPQH